MFGVGRLGARRVTLYGQQLGSQLHFSAPPTRTDTSPVSIRLVILPLTSAGIFPKMGEEVRAERRLSTSISLEVAFSLVSARS